MRYLIYFSYDGSKFHGLERQKSYRSVQGTLEQALSLILKTDIVIKASGRTDAGVHALGQTAHFDYDSKLPPNFKKKLNQELKDDIIIKKICRKDDNFHARFNVKTKTYCYVINLGASRRNDNYYFTTKYKLDLKKMRQAQKLFLKSHDFRNFVSGTRDNYETFITKVKIKKQNNFLIFAFTGTGFYRYMVRHLVGALFDVGRGKVRIDEVKVMLTNPEVPRQLTVMPGQGLYLVKVKY